MSLESLGPFTLPDTYVPGSPANTFTIISSGQFGNQPGQLGTIVLYNFSNYVIGLNSSSDGQLLDLQPGTGNIYNAPSNNGALVGVVKGGTPGGNPQLSGQVALYGEQIGGSWPETLAVPAATSSTVTLTPNPPPGADWQYILPMPSRWVGFYGAFFASGTAANRYVSLQAVVADVAPLVSPLGGGAPITASQTVNVSGFGNAEGLFVAQAWYTGPTPDLFLPAGTVLQSSTLNLDAGDKWEDILLVLSPD